jgi:hypothetical protein
MNPFFNQTNAQVAYSNEAIAALKTSFVEANAKQTNKMYFSTNIFLLPPIKTIIDSNMTVKDLLSIKFNTKAKSKEEEFNVYETALQEKAKKYFKEELKDKEDAVLLVQSIGLLYTSVTDKIDVTHYAKMAVVSGDKVDKEYAATLRDYEPAIAFDFNGKTFQQNDAWLKDYVDYVTGTKNLNEKIEVTFDEVEGQKGGWDDNKIEVYSSYNSALGKGIPYKFLRLGIEDKVSAIVSPAENVNEVYFDGGVNITAVSSPGMAQGGLEVKLNSITEGDKLSLIARKGDAKGKKVGALNILSYPEIVKTVSIRVINQGVDDEQVVPLGSSGLDSATICIKSGGDNFINVIAKGDDEVYFFDGMGEVLIAGPNGICETEVNVAATSWTTKDITTIVNKHSVKDYLNKLYGQVGIHWEVEFLPTLTINFDIDHNGLFNLAASNWPGTELKEILKHVNGGSGFDYYFFVMDHPDEELMGYMVPEQKVGLIFPDKHTASGANLVHQICQTIGHELGHGAFGLLHPFDETKFKGKYSPGMDPHNFMDYTEGDIIRSYQWKIIRK